MKLFNAAQIEAINAAAAKSKETLVKPKQINTRSINNELAEISQRVIEYFKDSPALLITSVEQLHDYVTEAIESGYCGIDTETTGLDRVKDWVVGASLYYPGGVEVYIPMKHLVPIFDEPCKGQLTYEEVGRELQRFADVGTKMIFANADFDLAMIYKDLKVDLIDVCYWDVIIAWRAMKEDELDNTLKGLYNKYVLRGKGDPMKFRDFFSPALFPYCKPEVAKLYAANDAKITYELFRWQLPYITKEHPKCIKAGMQAVSDLVWNVEIPLIKICQNMHRTGVYIDRVTGRVLKERYNGHYQRELRKLQDMVQEIIDTKDFPHNSKRPFASGKDFNPKSPPHVKYLVYTLLQVPKGKDDGTGKEILKSLNLPVTNQILEVRSYSVLINSFVDKIPDIVTPDSRLHAQFKQMGAATGRMSSAEPNVQNIPSHALDIRHMFRATPGYVMMSSDYSKMCAVVKPA